MSSPIGEYIHLNRYNYKINGINRSNGHFSLPTNINANSYNGQYNKNDIQKMIDLADTITAGLKDGGKWASTGLSAATRQHFIDVIEAKTTEVLSGDKYKDNLDKYIDSMLSTVGLDDETKEIFNVDTKKGGTVKVKNLDKKKVMYVYDVVKAVELLGKKVKDMNKLQQTQYKDIKTYFNELQNALNNTYKESNALVAAIKAQEQGMSDTYSNINKDFKITAKNFKKDGYKKDDFENFLRNLKELSVYFLSYPDLYNLEGSLEETVQKVAAELINGVTPNINTKVQDIIDVFKDSAKVNDNKVEAELNVDNKFTQTETVIGEKDNEITINITGKSTIEGKSDVKVSVNHNIDGKKAESIFNSSAKNTRVVDVPNYKKAYMTLENTNLLSMLLRIDSEWGNHFLNISSLFGYNYDIGQSQKSLNSKKRRQYKNNVNNFSASLGAGTEEQIRLNTRNAMLIEGLTGKSRAGNDSMVLIFNDKNTGKRIAITANDIIAKLLNNTSSPVMSSIKNFKLNPSVQIGGKRIMDMSNRFQLVNKWQKAGADARIAYILHQARMTSVKIGLGILM